MSGRDRPAGPGWLTRRLLGDLRRHPLVALAVAATFAGAALLFGGTRLQAAPPVTGLVAAPPRQAAVLAYLRDDIGDDVSQALERTLARLPGVAQVTRIAPAEALARMRRQLGERGRLLDGAEDGLLPVSLEVSLLDGARAGDDRELRVRAEQLGRRLRQIDGVSEVDLVPPAPLDGARPTAVAGLEAPLLTFGLGGLCAAGLVAALLGSLSARRARRRQETQLMLALGFTRAAAFLPATLSGLLAALGGTALGLLVLRIGWGLTGPGALSPSAAVRFLSARECAVALGIALCAGGLSGYVAARAPDPADAR